jgi:hypothetical protein
MNGILFGIVLNRHRWSSDIISFVHRRTVVFPITFIVGQMILDVLVDPMTICGVHVHGEPLIVRICMISFVSMVDVPKVVDAIRLSTVSSRKMNTCVIISVHTFELCLPIVIGNDSVKEEDRQFFFCLSFHRI